MALSSPAQPISYRPALPDWGTYLRWPVNGEDWIHPEDREAAQELIPSPRVFRRSQWDGEYYHLFYGELCVRVRPSMWLRLPDIDLEVGQQVELLFRHGQNDPGIFRIADIFYAPIQHVVHYYLQSETLRLGRKFSRVDLRPLHVAAHLRPANYVHHPASSQIPDDVELLNVGKLTS